MSCRRNLSVLNLENYLNFCKKSSYIWHETTKYDWRSQFTIILCTCLIKNILEFPVIVVTDGNFRILDIEDHSKDSFLSALTEVVPEMELFQENPRGRQIGLYY